MTIDIGFANIMVYLLVWVRLAGMVLFNPMLARSSIPAMVRMGLVLFLTFLIAPLQGEELAAAVYGLGDLGYMFAMVRELLIGLIYGFVFQIFYYFMFFVGDMIDTDIGLAMAKSFDPATNIQTSFSSALVTLLFSLYIFATGSHLTLIKLFADSFEAIPVGTFALTTDILSFVINLFSSIFLLALRLWAPIMVGEFALQISMGVLMKFIPQITVFVINFQLRIFLGILMIFMFAPFIGQFMDSYIDTLFDTLFNTTSQMATALP